MAADLAVIARRLHATVLPDKNDGRTNRFQIAGSSGNAYTISMLESDKSWQCSCRGWIGHRHCKHLDTMLPVLTASFPGSKASDRIFKIKKG